MDVCKFNKINLFLRNLGKTGVHSTDNYTCSYRFFYGVGGYYSRYNSFTNYIVLYVVMVISVVLPNSLHTHHFCLIQSSLSDFIHSQCNGVTPVNEMNTVNPFHIHP